MRTRGESMDGNGRIETRVSKLEASLQATTVAVENTARQVSQLAVTMANESDAMRQEVRQLARDFANARRPDWSVLISAAGLIAFLFGAGMTPLWLTLSYTRQDVAELAAWQQDYGRGQIPSSAEKSLAAIDVKFAEVETQFREARGLTEREREHTRGLVAKNEAALGQLDERVRSNTERLATIEERQRGCSRTP